MSGLFFKLKKDIKIGDKITIDKFVFDEPYSNEHQISFVIETDVGKIFLQLEKKFFAELIVANTFIEYQEYVQTIVQQRLDSKTNCYNCIHFQLENDVPLCLLSNDVVPQLLLCDKFKPQTDDGDLGCD